MRHFLQHTHDHAPIHQACTSSRLIRPHVHTLRIYIRNPSLEVRIMDGGLSFGRIELSRSDQCRLVGLFRLFSYHYWQRCPCFWTIHSVPSEQRLYQWSSWPSICSEWQSLVALPDLRMMIVVIKFHQEYCRYPHRSPSQFPPLYP